MSSLDLGSLGLPIFFVVASLSLCSLSRTHVRCTLAEALIDLWQAEQNRYQQSDGHHYSSRSSGIYTPTTTTTTAGAIDTAAARKSNARTLSLSPSPSPPPPLVRAG